MNTKAQNQTKLAQLWDDPTALEDYLTSHSNLPEPRANLEMMAAFADLAGERGEDAWSLLRRLAAIDADAAPTDDPREILACSAAQGIGAVGAAVSDRWESALAALRSLAVDPRWRVRESVAMGLQRLLAANFDASVRVLLDWSWSGEPLVVRAAVAGVADPDLLSDAARAGQAREVITAALEWLRALPADRRAEEHVRTLRKGLGFTLSVVVAAEAKAGFALLNRLARWGDDDVNWVLRENLKKKRLQPWADQIDQVQARLSGD